MIWDALGRQALGRVPITVTPPTGGIIARAPVRRQVQQWPQATIEFDEDDMIILTGAMLNVMRKRGQA